MKRVRFSLRTLLLLALAVAGGIGIWLRWEPWAHDRSFLIDSRDERSSAISPDGDHIIIVERDAVSRDFDISLWQTSSRTRIREYHVGSRLVDARVQFSPTGRWLHAYFRAFDAPGTEDLIWDALTGEPIRVDGTICYLSRSLSDPDRKWPDPGKFITFRCWQFSPDDRFIVYEKIQAHQYERPAENVLYVLDTLEKKVVAIFNRGEIRAVQFSADGERLALTTADKMLTIWNSKPRKIEFEWSLPFEPGNRLAFSPDGSRLAIRDDDYDTHILQTQTGVIESKFAGCASPPSEPLPASDCAPFSPDGTRLLTTSAKSQFTVTVWQISPPAALTAIPLGDVDDRAAFSSDGKTIFLDRNDDIMTAPSSCKAFDARTGAPVNRTRSDLSYTRPYLFTPDKTQILGSDGEHRMLLYRRRPEQWWGLAWLPEFWIATVCGIGAVWSFVRDCRNLKATRETQAPVSV